MCLLASSPAPVSVEPAVDDVPGDVVRSLTACWHPPLEGDEITVRMSVRRGGTVFGRPRITTMKASGGPDGEGALAN